MASDKAAAETGAKAVDSEGLVPLLRVRDLCQAFPMRVGGRKRPVPVVEGVSFDVAPGESLGLVGESGCGKTTVGRSIMHLYEPTSGTVELNGVPVTRHTAREAYRSMQMVFQDPYTSLDPRKTIAAIVEEPLRIQKVGDRASRREKAARAVQLVGLEPATLERYPFSLSGGQRQRVAIARALVSDPKFVICDEAVSALDVSVQAQVLNILVDLQRRLGLSYLFISHDLAVVRHVCERIAVMYLGRLVEVAPTDELFSRPRHPYVEALLSAIPVPDPARARTSRRITLEGELPALTNLPAGCVFSTRCPYAQERCHTQRPQLEEVAPGHTCACLRWRELQLSGVAELGIAAGPADAPASPAPR
ncbi:MAG: ABC transporter ATP-binding protein [Coriobacteriia bacterium]|nr:ABC transporter ATP-binding protein [Coriobacteriia bacterium]MBS5478450.1 ABC transporter ATP-binding protein [Coriobacteriia bacterium]